MRLNLYPFLFLAILLLACHRDHCDNNPANPSMACVRNSTIPYGSYLQLQNLPPSSTDSIYCGYLPLSRKNYWVYLDSVYDQNGIYTHSIRDTLRYTVTRRLQDGIAWWSTDSVGNLKVWALYPRFVYSTDSVLYFISERRTGAPFFKAITSDTLIEGCQYSDHSQICESVKNPNPVVVPAGTFTNCMKFNKTWVLGYYEIETHFKPGIGVLKTRYFTDRFTFPFRMIRTSTLEAYHIEN